MDVSNCGSGQESRKALITVLDEHFNSDKHDEDDNEGGFLIGNNFGYNKSATTDCSRETDSSSSLAVSKVDTVDEAIDLIVDDFLMDCLDVVDCLDSLDSLDCLKGDLDDRSRQDKDQRLPQTKAIHQKEVTSIDHLSLSGFHSIVNRIQQSEFLREYTERLLLTKVVGAVDSDVVSESACDTNSSDASKSRPTPPPQQLRRLERLLMYYQMHLHRGLLSSLSLSSPPPPPPSSQSSSRKKPPLTSFESVSIVVVCYGLLVSSIWKDYEWHGQKSAQWNEINLCRYSCWNLLELLDVLSSDIAACTEKLRKQSLDNNLMDKNKQDSHNKECNEIRIQFLLPALFRILAASIRFFSTFSTVPTVSKNAIISPVHKELRNPNEAGNHNDNTICFATEVLSRCVCAMLPFHCKDNESVNQHDGSHGDNILQKWLFHRIDPTLVQHMSRWKTAAAAVAVALADKEHLRDDNITDHSTAHFTALSTEYSAAHITDYSNNHHTHNYNDEEHLHGNDNDNCNDKECQYCLYAPPSSTTVAFPVPISVVMDILGVSNNLQTEKNDNACVDDVNPTFSSTLMEQDWITYNHSSNNNQNKNLDVAISAQAEVWKSMHELLVLPSHRDRLICSPKTATSFFQLLFSCNEENDHTIQILTATSVANTVCNDLLNSTNLNNNSSKCKRIPSSNRHTQVDENLIQQQHSHFLVETNQNNIDDDNDDVNTLHLGMKLIQTKRFRRHSKKTFSSDQRLQFPVSRLFAAANFVSFLPSCSSTYRLALWTALLPICKEFLEHRSNSDHMAALGGAFLHRLLRSCFCCSSLTEALTTDLTFTSTLMTTLATTLTSLAATLYDLIQTCRNGLTLAIIGTAENLLFRILFQMTKSGSTLQSTQALQHQLTLINHQVQTRRNLTTQQWLLVLERNIWHSTDASLLLGLLVGGIVPILYEYATVVDAIDDNLVHATAQTVRALPLGRPALKALLPILQRFGTGTNVGISIFQSLNCNDESSTSSNMVVTVIQLAAVSALANAFIAFHPIVTRHSGNILSQLLLCIRSTQDRIQKSNNFQQQKVQSNSIHNNDSYIRLSLNHILDRQQDAPIPETLLYKLLATAAIVAAMAITICSHHNEDTYNTIPCTTITNRDSEPIQFLPPPLQIICNKCDEPMAALVKQLLLLAKRCSIVYGL